MITNLKSHLLTHSGLKSSYDYVTFDGKIKLLRTRSWTCKPWMLSVCIQTFSSIVIFRIFFTFLFAADMKDFLFLPSHAFSKSFLTLQIGYRPYKLADVTEKACWVWKHFTFLEIDRWFSLSYKIFLSSRDLRCFKWSEMGPVLMSESSKF